MRAAFLQRLQRATRAVRAALDAEIKEPVPHRFEVALGDDGRGRPLNTPTGGPNLYEIRIPVPGANVYVLSGRAAFYEHLNYELAKHNEQSIRSARPDRRRRAR